MGAFSVWHWLIVLAVAAMVFGTGKLRAAGKDLGEGIRGFKRAIADEGASARGEGEAPQRKDGA